MSTFGMKVGICVSCGRKRRVNSEGECFDCFRVGLKALGYDLEAQK